MKMNLLPKAMEIAVRITNHFIREPVVTVKRLWNIVKCSSNAPSGAKASISDLLILEEQLYSGLVSLW